MKSKTDLGSRNIAKQKETTAAEPEVEVTLGREGRKSRDQEHRNRLT